MLLQHFDDVTRINILMTKEKQEQKRNHKFKNKILSDST